jgi:hypothetical protein
VTPYLVVWAYGFVLLVLFVGYWMWKIERRHHKRMAAIEEAERSDAREFARKREQWDEYLRSLRIPREEISDEFESLEDDESASLVVRGVTNNDTTVEVSVTAGNRTLTVPATPIATPHGWEAVMKGLPAKAVSELLTNATS